MKYSPSLPLAILLAAAQPLSAEPTRVWSHGNPSNEEQYALQVLNQLRADPHAALDLYVSQAGLSAPAATMVANAKEYVVTTPGSAATIYVGAKAMHMWLDRGLASFKTLLNPRLTADTMPAKAPLAFYPLFNEQARTQGPAMMSASLPDITMFGFWGVTTFFNVDTSQFPAKVPGVPFVSGFTAGTYRAPRLTGPNATGGTAVIKPGVSDTAPVPYFRGETLWTVNFFDPTITLREAFLSNILSGPFYKNIMTDTFTSNFNQTNQGRTRMIGINVGPARTSAPGIGARLMSVMGTDSEAFETSDLPFGAKTLFIVGVVYADTDKNADYTPGEGLGDLEVKPNTGDWYAVTSSSGGYAIPVQPNAGVVSLSVTVNGVVMTKTVTIGSDSVTVDFVQTKFPKPAQTSVGGSDGSNQIVNLSTRGVVETNASVMVGGFVISGTTPGKKTVLIRGVANSLLNFGINGVLTKPMLTLRNAQGVVVKSVRTDDIYTGSVMTKTIAIRPELIAAAQQVGAFALTVPWVKQQGDTSLIYGGSLYAQGDTAMVVTLDPGAYTATISPDTNWSTTALLQMPYNTNAGSGVALLEVYDMTPDVGGRFVNLATRGKVEPGDRQMIVGFSIRGSGHRQVLVRGVGPTLQSFGVAGALSDSAVSLFDADSNLLLSNDDWGLATWTTQAASVTPTVGAFSMDAASLDGVILAQLTPSSYTMMVSSATGFAGVALAEIYEH